MIKKIILLISVFAIAISLACLVYLFLWPKQTLKNGNNQDSINVSNWNTYRNEERGWEIKYPNEFDIITKYKQNPGDSFVLKNENKDAIWLNVFPYSKNEAYKINFSNFCFFVTDRLGTLTEGELKTKDINCFEKNIQDRYGVEANFLLQAKFVNVSKAYSGDTVWTYIFSKGTIVGVEALSGYRNLSQPEFQNLIISTFKFIR